MIKDIRRILLFILIFFNIILLIGLIWLYGKIDERGKAISRLQEQVAYLVEQLPAKSSPELGKGSESKILSLIDDLKKRNLITQYQAGLKLKKIGPPAVPYLVEALRQTKGKDSRPILLLLHGLGDKELTPDLIEIFKSSDDTINKAGIITILGKWSDYRARNLILDVTKEKDWRLRATAAQALTNYEGEDILTALIHLLGDKNKNIRSVAQRTLKALAAKEGGVSTLRSILKEGDHKTRYLLVKHLPKISGNEAKHLLQIATQDKEKAIRQTAIMALSAEK